MSNHLRNIFIVFFISANAHTSSATIVNDDTLAIQQKISNWMNAFKCNNKAQLYKYSNSDSTIIFGSNKQKSFLTSVVIFDKKKNENRWYYYDQGKVFRISIMHRKSPEVSKSKKRMFCDYYFEDGKLLFQKGDCMEATTELLSSALQYQIFAKSYLNN